MWVWVWVGVWGEGSQNTENSIPSFFTVVSGIFVGRGASAKTYRIRTHLYRSTARYTLPLMGVQISFGAVACPPVFELINSCQYFPNLFDTEPDIRYVPIRFLVTKFFI